MTLTKGSRRDRTELLDYPNMGKQLLSWPFVLGDILLWLHESAIYDIGKVTGDWPGSPWIDIFDVIIKKLRNRLNEGARYALEVACQTGCLVLVKRLFKAADLFLRVRTNLLPAQDQPEDDYHNLGIYKHHPLGVAAHYGHADIVQFLCHQEGIEPQRLYANGGGDNVFHAVAAPQSRCDERILRNLLEQWPDGIHRPCRYGDTTLNLLVFTGCRASSKQRGFVWSITIPLFWTANQYEWQPRRAISEPAMC